MFFHENLVAYHDGRAEKDPTEYWYKGEIGFFDFYSKYLLTLFAEKSSLAEAFAYKSLAFACT